MTKILEIQTEGPRVETPRNVKRMLLEVETDRKGCAVHGHNVRRGEPVMVEIYVDRLRAVADRVRTSAHEEAMLQAGEMADRLIATWKASRKLDLAALPNDEERKAYVARECPHAPEQLYEHFGFRHGMPPLTSLSIVSQDHRKRIKLTAVDASDPTRLSLAEWDKLDDAAQDEYLREPPKTGGNDMERAVAAMAAVMQRAAGRAEAPSKGAKG